jgi:hypothetical protein
VKPLILAAALALLAAPASATAAPWRQVTADGGTSIDQVGIVRTGDGVLHVAWHEDGDLRHTAISPRGRIGATTPIQSGWTGHMDPALTVVPGGIRVVWGAIRSTDTSDPNQDLNTAFSGDGGASWALTLGSIIPRGAQAYGSDASATTLPGGTVLQAWAGTLGTWVHAGLNPATPNFDYQAPLGPYGYGPGLASDASGRAMMAWFSSGANRRGVVAQSVNANGSPGGATYVKRVRPGLTLRARKRDGRVTFTVTDAGDPVRGAKVRVGGKSGRTDRRGRVTLDVKRGRAKATASGYARATLRIRG